MPRQHGGGEWTEDFFGGIWLDFQRTLHPPELTARQAEGLIELLAMEPGERVLDAPCGEGRLALAFAQRGMDVTGIDQNQELLADARGRATTRGLAARFEQCDLRDAGRLVDPVGGDDPFDVVVNFWGSFGYFGDGGVQAAADPARAGGGDLAFARAAASVLRPGGFFVIDIPGIERIMNGYSSRGWSRAGDITVLEDRAWDPVEGVMHVEWTLIRQPADAPPQVELRHTHIRMYSAPELCRLLARAGFSSFDLFSDPDGSPWSPGDRMLMVATR